MLGTINIGCGYSQLCEFTSTLNIPPMSYNLYKSIEENLTEVVKQSSWNSMLEAGQLEAALAVERAM